MTTIKANCPNCGDVKLTPDDLVIYMPTREAREGKYTLNCNSCTDSFILPAPQRIVSILMAVGVQIEYESDSEVFSEEYITKELESFAAELETSSRLTEVLEQEQEDEDEEDSS